MPSSLSDLELAFLSASAPPLAANILNGSAAFAVTTAATTLITIPAGRTWEGVIGASCACRTDAAGTAVGLAAAAFTVAGAGAAPPAGAIFGVRATNSANAATGTVGSEGNNFGSMPITVIAPGGNSVTIQVATTNTGSASTVDAFASGKLI